MAGCEEDAVIVVSEVSKDKKKVTRGKRFSNEEVFTLCEFVKSHEGDLFGSSSGHGVANKKRKAWEQAALEVEKIGDGSRGGGPEMRIKWNDLAYRAKKYNTARRGNKTGGGPQEPENMRHEAVLGALPKDTVNGILQTDGCETTPAVSVMSESNVKSEYEQPSTSSASVNVIVTETETDLSQSQDSGRHRAKKRNKKRKVKKETKDVYSREVDLLQLNKNMYELQEKKFKHKEEELKVQKEMVQVLKDINENIKRLIPQPTVLDLPQPTVLDLFSSIGSVQVEQ